MIFLPIDERNLDDVSAFMLRIVGYMQLPVSFKTLTTFYDCKIPKKAFSAFMILHESDYRTVTVLTIYDAIPPLTRLHFAFNISLESPSLRK